LITSAAPCARPAFMHPVLDVRRRADATTVDDVGAAVTVVSRTNVERRVVGALRRRS
jgi:hypothetical protein